LLALHVQAQHDITIDAKLNAESGIISITQKIVYKNHATVPLQEIYLNDWANSFSSKTTPLAKRFSEDYEANFHFEKNENRGHSIIHSISNEHSIPLTWERGEEVDIVKVKLDRTLEPGENFRLQLQFDIKLPNDKFTRYGITDSGDFKIRYWYMSPAVFDGEWHYYSNKDLNDSYLSPSTFNIIFDTPNYFSIVSDLNIVSETVLDNSKITKLTGDKRMQVKLDLHKSSSFETVVTDKLELTSDLKNGKISSPIKALVIDRVIHFLDEKLGPYPFEKMVVSEIDYKRNPVYGLNLLPDFISPFPEGFEYDMEHLKIISRTYLENTLAINPREDHWLIGAFQIYLMMEYVDTYYPKMKIIGNLSKIWVISWAHASDLEFNDQYSFLYMNMARNNLNQKITTPKDSLLEFNKNIASDYYAGNGLQYLSDYLGKDVVLKSIKQFQTDTKLKQIKAILFQEYLQNNTKLPVDWFFKNYIDNKSTIDFTFRKVKKMGDSIEIDILNKKGNSMPVSVYGLNKDKVLFKKWIQAIDSSVTIKVPSKDLRKLALNYEGIIPEYNQRNNYKNIKGIFNKPFQVRLFKDIEDPKYSQLFVMPVYSFNVYDGITIGPKLYNKTILPKTFHYNLKPQYAFKSKTIVGSGSLSYRKRPEFGSLYSFRAGVSGRYFSYDQDLFFKRISPFVTFSFRDKTDLRNNEKHFISVRNVTVDRDKNPNKPLETPNYSVFNVKYAYSNPNLINYYRAGIDYQISSEFSKVSTTLKYRKLFLNNRQLNVRFFAGLFIRNKTSTDDDYFSFALDRPTDYLFDYNYYARSDESGFFSQQIIIAEGGFKSQLEPAFSNSWITTMNVSTNIWKWIFVYGDAGLVNNKEQGTKALYDSGIRLSLLSDYFEFYFPLYSSLGWEPGLANYEEKIRFIITIDPQTLFGLFSRKWY